MFMRFAIVVLAPLFFGAFFLLPAASANSFGNLTQNANKFMQSGSSTSNSSSSGSLLNQLTPNSSASTSSGVGSLLGKMASGSSASKTAGRASLLSQLASGSLGLGSIQNAAGVLGYCYKNGYIAGPGQQVKNKLMSMVGGRKQVQQSASYQSGLNGLLRNQSGQAFSLTTLKSMVGKRVCSFVVNQAKSSFLGG